MFTGIIREVGILRERISKGGGVELTIEAPQTCARLQEGGSVALDGVCLTATSVKNGSFSADVVPETLSRSRLGELRPGDRVNLELPLTLSQLVDGHLVQGHVDGLGVVTEVLPEGSQNLVTIEVDRALAPFLAEKGSVAVNGVSLTVVRAGEDFFSVALIPTTLKETNLNELSRGTPVNLEVDLLARYVARLQSASVTAELSGKEMGS